MATFNKLPSSRWRVQIRRKRYYASRVFRLKIDAEAWALEVERAIECGKNPTAPKIERSSTFGDLIDLHVDLLLHPGRNFAPAQDEWL